MQALSSVAADTISDPKRMREILRHEVRWPTTAWPTSWVMGNTPS